MAGDGDDDPSSAAFDSSDDETDLLIASMARNRRKVSPPPPPKDDASAAVKGEESASSSACVPKAEVKEDVEVDKTTVASSDGDGDDDGTSSYPKATDTARAAAASGGRSRRETTRVFDLVAVAPDGVLTPLDDECAAIDAIPAASSSRTPPKRLVPLRPLLLANERGKDEKKQKKTGPGSLVMDLEEAPPISARKEKVVPPPPPPPPPRDPKKVFVVKARKRLPKYVGGGNSGPLLFTEKWLRGKLELLNALLEREAGFSPSKCLRATLGSVPDDPFSVRLVVSGRKDLADRLKRSVEMRVNREMLHHNLPALVRGTSNLEIDLAFDCSTSASSDEDDGIGAIYHSQSRSLGKDTPARMKAWGVWVSSAAPGSPLLSALGLPAIVTGCAILAVDGARVYETDDIYDAWVAARKKAKKEAKKAASKGTKTAAAMKVKVKVTVCLHRDADLSEADASWLFAGAGGVAGPARRRSGASYRGRYGRYKNVSAPPAVAAGAAARRNHVRPHAASESTTTVARVPAKKRKATAMELPRQGGAAGSSAAVAAPVPKKKPLPLSDGGGRGPSEAETELQQSTACATKYKRLKEIEYKPVGINGLSANSCMWKRHKEMYGSTCDDQCPCPSDLASLTDTVVPRHLKNKKGRNPHGLDPAESPYGFVTHFAPKFYGRLGEEFPDTNHAERLTMLFQLWPMHTGQHRFGEKCREDCPCGEGWPMFLKRLKRERGKAGKKPSAPRRAGAGQDAVAAAPRRASTGQGAAAPRRASAARTGSLLRHISAPSNDETAQFRIRFNAGEPLGFYSVDEGREAQGGVVETVCRLLSIAPDADPRLRVGTAIVGTALWSIDSPKEPMEPLSTYMELKARYEAARGLRDSPKLRIWFDNSEAPPAVPAAAALKKPNEWLTKGKWKGDPDLGWAGGAAVIPRELKKPPQASAHQSGSNMIDVTSSAGDTMVGSARASAVGTNTSSSRDSTTGVPMATHVPATHRERLIASGLGEAKINSSQDKKLPGPSVLRKSKRDDPGRKRGRKIAISHEPPKTKLFMKDSEWPEEDTTPIVEATVVDDQGLSSADQSKSDTPTQAATVDIYDIPIQHRRSNELKKAILHKDYEEVIRQLKDGAHAQCKDSAKKLPRDYTKERLETVGQDLRNAHGEVGEKLKSIQKDLHLKDTVLKIFIHAEHVLNIARHLQEWISVEIVPQRAIGLQLTEKGRTHQSSDFVFAVVKIDGQVQEPTMPLVPFTASPDWSTVQNAPVYSLAYNSEMDYTYTRGRRVKVDIVKGSSKSGNNIKLGTWEERVEEIKDLLDSTKDTEVDHELIRSEFLVAGASMSVKFRERAVNSEFVLRKQQEGSKELATLVDWLENFRRETKANALDANISLPFVGGLSLLHAAVFLADLTLVYRLLALGADPCFVSADAGSAENLAFNLVQKTTQDQETHGKLVNIMNILKKDAAERKKRQVEAESRKVQSGDEATTEGSDNVSPAEGGHPHSATSQQSHQHQVLAEQPQQYGQVHTASYHQYPANAPDQPGQASIANHPQAERLPKLMNIDWVQEKSERCTSFNQPGGCSLGRNCVKAHVHPPIGFALNSGAWPEHEVMKYSGDLWSARNIHVHPPMISPAGKQWYTCAYFDPNTNVIFYSEGGSSALLSEQGVYWYPTEGAAIVACKRVVLSASRTSTNAQFASSEPPPTSLSTSWTTSTGSSLLDNYAQVFSKLQTADMQAIYNKVFPRNSLPRTVWKSERGMSGSVTTAFHSPAKEAMGEVHPPVGFGGTNLGGRWWYADEKVAKAAAFVQFLLACARKGLVTQDLMGTTDGRPFFKK